MKMCHFCQALACLAVWSLPASAVDLSKIDRRIAKEPAYESKTPTYCLLVFGPEAKHRVWLVLDGELLYIDRHADGDLTHPDDRLKAHRVTKDPPNFMSSETTVFLDVIPPGDPGGRNASTLTGSTRYSRLWVSSSIPRDSVTPPTEDQKEFLERLRHHYTAVYLRIDEKYTQMGWACFSERPQDAPILHFDGPLTFGFGQDFGPFKQPALLRGPDPSELMVNVITPGLGKDAVVTMDTRYAPADVHPVADIEFPSKQPGGTPIQDRIVLNERC
jgi:hypothetical protein